jgi:hypothetical protein
MNTEEIIRQAMSELGKRSAKKNKRDYSAMGKRGGWPKGKPRKKPVKVEYTPD